ncbi:hypothetical protein [Nonomuraea rubra]|uniref:Uncharacterized protein n=1 Tax=Nonomuraea rubra TaxID=46180 RepID=A0A7X0P866_9ACTN|nr:hypothetical protein [Nonomuraea rubra]MBB6557090.1 hypothetical protein [Nonomuraea rubra]
MDDQQARPPYVTPERGARPVGGRHLSTERGVTESIGLAERLAPYGIRLDFIGSEARDVGSPLRRAQRVGLAAWFGYVLDRHAVLMAEGAMAGLSLADDIIGTPPTK